MSLLDPARAINNIIALGVIFWVGFMIYTKMDKGRAKETIESLKNLFGKIGGNKDE